MQKLTKEQAEWLIENIEKSSLENTYNNSPLDEAILRLGNIKKIINQCTEQEFPEFRGDASSTRIKIFLNKEELWPITLWISDISAVADFSVQQFRRFTEGCNKIVEWLNSQCSLEP